MAPTTCSTPVNQWVFGSYIYGIGAVGDSGEGSGFEMVDEWIPWFWQIGSAGESGGGAGVEMIDQWMGILLWFGSGGKSGEGAAVEEIEEEKN